MKKTILALAVALFCTTATTQAQSRNGAYNNRPGYSDDVYNTRSYGDDRDPWHDGRRAYDRQYYNRNWVVVAPGRRNRPAQGHWVYVPRAPRRQFAPPVVVYPLRYCARPGFAVRGRW